MIPKPKYHPRHGPARCLHPNKAKTSGLVIIFSSQQAGSVWGWVSTIILVTISNSLDYIISESISFLYKKKILPMTLSLCHVLWVIISRQDLTCLSPPPPCCDLQERDRFLLLFPLSGLATRARAEKEETKCQSTIELSYLLLLNSVLLTQTSPMIK